VGLLEISVAAGDHGPVLMLSGEADLTTAAELSDALTAQLASGTPYLTVDVSRLQFADSAVIRALVLANRTLKARGGGMELVHPQPVVARALSLLGVDQVIEVRDERGRRAGPLAGPGLGRRGRGRGQTVPGGRQQGTGGDDPDQAAEPGDGQGRVERRGDQRQRG
jgi:anti-sigma B factor antagonist